MVEVPRLAGELAGTMTIAIDLDRRVAMELKSSQLRLIVLMMIAVILSFISLIFYVEFPDTTVTPSDTTSTAATTDSDSSTIFVEDNANVLSDSTKQEIDSLNRRWSKLANKPQLLVVTANHIPGGQSIEQWSMSIAEDRKPGDGKADTGLVYVIAVKDHQDRLEVGYGLEDVITDSVSSDLIKSAEAEYKTGDYNAGVETLAKKVDSLVTPNSRQPENDSNSDDPLIGTLCNLSLLIIAIIMFIYFFAYGIREHYHKTDEEDEPIVSSVHDHENIEDDKPIPVPVDDRSATVHRHRDDDDDDDDAWSGLSSSRSSFNDDDNSTSFSSSFTPSFGGESFGGGSFGGGGASGSW